MGSAKRLVSALLVALFVAAAWDVALAQDSWSVASQDIPSALAWEGTGEVSVGTDNTGATTWDEVCALVSVEGEVSDAHPVDRWGLTSAPVRGAGFPGKLYPFVFTIAAPPLTTLSYASLASPTSPGAVSDLACNWMLADPYTPTAALIRTDMVEGSTTICRFADILPETSGAWAAFYIEECAGRVPLIVGGFDDGTYRPGLEVDRAQMAVYMARSLKLPTGPYEGSFAADVPESHWAWPWIEALARVEIVSGFGGGYYQPDLPVDRAAMAVYVARGMVGSVNVPTGPAEGTFEDVADYTPGPAHWAYDEIEYCVAHGVVRGYDLTHYVPGNLVTRDQMAVFVCKGFIMPTGTPVVLGGPATTAVNPETAGYWGWSSRPYALPGSQNYAYVVFDAVRLGTKLACGGTWEVAFELQGPVVRSYTASITADDITAAKEAALTTGVPYYAVPWALPTDLAEGDYTLVVKAEDQTGAMQEVARQPALAVTSLRYQALVPATLDLEERGELAINAITGFPDPESGYIYYYFMLFPDLNPPRFGDLRLEYFDKGWEALPLLRSITGSDLNRQVGEAWETFIRQWGESGWPGAQPTWPSARLLMTVTDYYVLSGDPIWKEYGDQLVAGWWSAMVDQGTYCYEPGPDGMPTGWDATPHGWTLEALAHYYLATGNTQAIEFAGKVARYIKDYAQIFDAEGHFLAAHPSDMGPALHFHHNANAMQALGWYAWVTGDAEYAEFVRKGYEYAKSVSTPEVGYFPEYIDGRYPDDRPYHDTEVGCESRDMMDMAILLTRMGVGDYWEDVDQTVRNMFAEGQILDYQWMYDVSSGYPYTPPGPGDSVDGAPERSVGSFCGWVLPDDMWMGWGPVVMACCVGNGSRVLYTVWQNILEYSGGELRVNLLLNRASQWADLNSYIPYEGKVDLHMKCAASGVSVRIPNWVTDEEVACTVNGAPRAFAWSGRYISLGTVNADDLVQVTFPISERTAYLDFSDRLYPFEYTLVFKGNDVVSMDPPGTYRPLFQRERYRENVASWKMVTRVIVDETALPW